MRKLTIEEMKAVCRGSSRSTGLHGVGAGQYGGGSSGSGGGTNPPKPCAGNYC